MFTSWWRWIYLTMLGKIRIDRELRICRDCDQSLGILPGLCDLWHNVRIPILDEVMGQEYNCAGVLTGDLLLTTVNRQPFSNGSS
jgi:hypothetical protein